MESSKILFIDIDGPMIPLRAYRLPGQTGIVSVFDPCAVSLVKDLLDSAQAKIVVSSSWRIQGYDRCHDVFLKNGLNPDTYFHADWRTPSSFSSSRHHEIREWLTDHPEVTHYVAIDDENLPWDLVPYAVKCDTYEGFSYRNYLEAKLMIGAELNDLEVSRAQATIDWIKRNEVWRTFRSGEPGQWKTREAVRMMFDDNEDEE